MVMYCPTMEQEAPKTASEVKSPYAVPVASVALPLATDSTAPLYPFEERQLQNLFQQIAAAPPRVRAAFHHKMMVGLSLA